MVDRGWRRSGYTYYKPDLTRSCCPHYTIRLDAGRFRANKSQRQALNRWNRYVLGTEYLSGIARLCPRSREEKRRRKTSFDLEASVHMSEYLNLEKPIDPKTKQRTEPAHKFEITLESDAFSEEKWNVFVAYQMTIHKEPASRCGRKSFERFLCSGLDRKIIKSGGVTRKLGSYHQCYRLDGRLIAVAVLDLLPHGVSSVYLFYDPKDEQWELGKLSALREIALTREGSYQYYYMGYYIPSCIKMRYKGSFWPSYILDPESLDWNLFDENLRTALDTHHYFSSSGSTKCTKNKIEKGGKPKDSQAPGNHKQEPDIDYTTLELDSDNELADDIDIPEGSLFDYDVPGILTKDEVEKLNLSKWKIQLRNDFVEMEDFKGWETSKITDPQSIKGIVAELAAALGPEVVGGGSAVNLFYD